MKQKILLSNLFVYIMFFTLTVFSANAFASPAAVDLLTAGNFVILTETGITNTGSHTSAITGNIGSSPITAAAMNNVFCSEMSGTIYGVDAAYVGSGNPACFAGTPADKTLVDNTVGDMVTAYTNAAGRTGPDATELYTGDLSGRTLAPGLYKWSTDVNINTDVTLSGSSTDIWVFQIAGDLNVASGASVPAGVKVLLTGGAKASNVFWQVGGLTGATLGTYSTFNGNILSAKQVIIQTGAVLNGRALAQTQVTLDANPISSPGAASVFTAISLIPSSANLTIGSTQQLNATGFDQFGSSMTAIINYTSSNSSVVIVNATSGLVTGIAAGNTTITASSGSVSNTSVITVNAAPATTIGNASNINTTLTNVTVKINGVNVTDGMSISGNNPVNITSNGLPVINFNYNFSESPLNFSALNITNGTRLGAYYFVVKGVNSTGAQIGTKTVYLYNVSTSFNGICVQNIENAQVPSVNCSNVDEFVLSCNGVTDSNGVTCTKSAQDTTLTISGLRHSGIIQLNVPSNIGPVNLGTSGSFVILAKTGITTTGTTLITGNIGVSPIDSTAITGFGLIMDSSNTFSTSSLVNGSIYAADYTSPTPSVMTTAVSDMETAYTDAAGRTIPDHTELGAGDISGMTLYPGLYKWGTGVVINTCVTLDCQGNSSSVFIFQISQDLTVGNGAIVTLSGSCQAKNIFWQVGGGTGVALGTTSVFSGNILAIKGIVINNGATLNGRALSQTAVTMIGDNVSSPTAASAVLTTITLSPTAANLTLTINGSTLQLNATKLDQFGLPMAANISYSSSNSSVATVNTTSGLVTAIGPGSATINATSGAVNGTIIITVKTDTPILNTIGSRSVTKDTWINFTITATSPGGFNNLNFTIAGKPAAANFTDNHNGTAMFSWMPNSSNVGVNNVNFTVTDSMKTANEVVAITVNLFQAPTTVPGDVLKNADYNVTLNATSFNNTPIAYINYTLNNVSGQINGSFGNVLINTSGNNTLTFYAVDTSGNVETTNTINAILDKTPPSAPTVTLSISGTIYTGDSLTFSCSGSTDNLGTVTYTKSTVITSTAGTKEAKCTATDNAGNENSTILSYVVNERSHSGGGGSSSTLDNSQSTSFSEMAQGLTNIEFTKEGLAITNIEIKTIDNATDVKITATQLAEKPTSVTTPNLDKIYGYLLIDHTNLNNSMIESVKIQFKLSKSWLTSNGVDVNQIKLYRYTSNWDAMVTTMISQDSTYYYFEADSPGLSYFVIGTEKIETTTSTTTTPTTSTTTTPTQQPTIGNNGIIPTDQNLLTGQVIGGTGEFNPSWWIISLILFIVIGLIVSGYFYFRK